MNDCFKIDINLSIAQYDNYIRLISEIRYIICWIYIYYHRRNEITTFEDSKFNFISLFSLKYDVYHDKVKDICHFFSLHTTLDKW